MSLQCEDCDQWQPDIRVTVDEKGRAAEVICGDCLRKREMVERVRLRLIEGGRA